MGLAPGGMIKQIIHEDEYGLEVWEQETYSRCYTHLVNSERFQGITDKAAPTQPVTPEQYKDAGIPWFDLYKEKPNALAGSGVLHKLASYGKATFDKTGKPLPNNQSIPIADTVSLNGEQQVRDREF